MEKEEVFSIMGKYYGNAYYKSANLTPEDALVITKALDEINVLGYNFSNLHAVEKTYDPKIVKIITNLYKEYSPQISIGLKEGLLSCLSKKQYHSAVPFLLNLYSREKEFRLKFRISDVLFHIRDKAYESKYFQIIGQSVYRQCDRIYDLLCVMKSQIAYQRIIELVRQYPDEFKFSFLRYGWYYKDSKLIPLIETFLQDKNLEVCMIARQALRKITT